MLIDTSYFEGDLEIGQITSPPVMAAVNLFIEKYEEELLTKLLGYPLYKAFMTGLAAMPVDQRWLDLVNGAEYTWNGYLRKFNGLIHQIGVAVDTAITSPVTIIVGGSGTYDPAPGTVATIPSELVGVPFVFMQRGFGPLRSDEFSVVGNQLTLLGGYVFSAGDTYFYFSDGQFSVNAGSGNKRSPIANYVYYHWIKDNNSFTTGSGEKQSASTISVTVSPVSKMTRAWNEMAAMNVELEQFLQSNLSVYPEWIASNYQVDLYSGLAKSRANLFKTTNILGI